MRGLIVTGTDTEIGKSVVCAWLLANSDSYYWKPVQSGLESETDSEFVSRVAELSPNRILPETYRLNEPQSPHLSARLDGLTIDIGDFVIPTVTQPLVVEGAGGLLVPLNDTELMIDLFARLALPILLVSRGTLGTINHTLLSIEALRNRGLPLLGVVISGSHTTENIKAIEKYGDTEVVAILPQLEQMSAEYFARVPLPQTLRELLS